MTNTKTQAFMPNLIAEKNKSLLSTLGLTLGGVILLSLLAQITIVLPFSPVPITGQTLGVGLISLLWGSKHSVRIVAAYLLLGFLGAPVFAAGKSGLFLGATSGYLLGMLVASYVMGSLADKGFAKNFFKAWATLFLGSLITFACGLLVLSSYVPAEQLLNLGVLPFLPGDLIKSLTSAGLVTSLYKSFKV